MRLRHRGFNILRNSEHLMVIAHRPTTWRLSGGAERRPLLPRVIRAHRLEVRSDHRSDKESHEALLSAMHLGPESHLHVRCPLELLDQVVRHGLVQGFPSDDQVHPSRMVGAVERCLGR